MHRKTWAKNRTDYHYKEKSRAPSMQAASEQACRSHAYSFIPAEVSTLIRRKAQGESQNPVASLVQICILGGLWSKLRCKCLHTQCLFPLHWGISTNASLNLNLSLCMSLIVTFHHPKQLVSPGLLFADEGRFPLFLTKSTT